MDQTRHYLIFGATGGIGSCLSRTLAAAGHEVFLAGRDADKLKALGDELGAPTCGVEAHRPETIEEAFAVAEQVLGEVHGVVNCIGNVLLHPLISTSDEAFAETLQVNLASSFYVLRGAAKMLRQPGSAVVLIASAAAEIGMPNHEAIAAAKAGVVGLARAAAASYAAKGLRINVVAPGLTQTGATRSIWENPLNAEASRSMHPMGRLGEARDVSSAIQWLLSPAASWVTGQVLGIDGGLSHLMSRRRG